MAHQFVFLCPQCLAEDTINKSKCQNCHASISISNTDISFQNNTYSLSEYLIWMKKQVNIKQAEEVISNNCSPSVYTHVKNPIRVSGLAILYQGVNKLTFQGYRNLFTRYIEIPQKIASGRLFITKDQFFFINSKQIYDFQISQLTCVTTNSHYFEFRMRGLPFYQIRFLSESPLKYEIIFQKLLDLYYTQFNKSIIEYQPYLKFEAPSPKREKIELKKMGPPERNIIEQIISKILLIKIRFFLRLFIKVEVSNKDNVPNNFPFIAIANHQSIFDPFIILSFLDSRIGFLTKSTSFKHWYERIVLRLGRAIPTTRYQTDPTVIRHIKTFIEHGIPVGIFPEGERCWDGKMLSFKLNVIRLLAYLQVPVVPIVIKNTFNFMPRWGKWPKRQRIEVNVDPPFCINIKHFKIDEIKKWIESIFNNFYSL